MQAQNIFDRLWAGYTQQNPEALSIFNLFMKEGETVVNDHIAFRTFNDPRINIDVLAKPFLAAGYLYKDSYNFEDKHLFARHYEHPEIPDAPRVFISELIAEDFSYELQSTINCLTDKIATALLDSDELLFSGSTWGTPSYDRYLKLRSESEYAAWVYVYGFRANHFTVSINSLKKHNTIEKVNLLLKNNGFVLNDAGGEIKGTPAELLEQSSTRAGILPVTFQEGVYEIPSCYYEFARRYPDSSGKLYSGFIAKSADKIFESTDYYKK
jgi:hypothetical protein